MAVGFDRIGYSGASKRKRSKEKLLFIGGGLVVCALLIIGGVLMIYSELLQASPFSTVSVPMEENGALGTVYLVAPASRIEKGAKITKNFLRKVVWPRDKVPDGAVRDIEDIENMFALVNLAENEPIKRNAVAPAPPMFSIAELLPPGHRAISVSVDKTSSVEGWATPGSHVDVILSYTDANDSMPKTRVAIENAVVLSLGGRSASDRENEGAGGDDRRGESTVTLGVPFMDVLKLQQAVTMGKVNLVLRSPTDITSPGKTTFDPSCWDGNCRKEAPKVQARADGFAAFTDTKGNRHDFSLLGGKWEKGTGGDDEYDQ